MSKYFDKDFFKFFLGFVVIIAFSMILIMMTKIYQEKTVNQTANTFDSLAQE